MELQTVTLLWILGSTLAISLISLVGVFTFSLNDKLLGKMLLVMVGFSAGSLMGGAFLHLLPESFENTSVMNSFLFVLIGFSFFFLIERFLHWRHCHEGKCDIHAFTYMNLIGDSIHNFIDGIIIAISFIVDIRFGVVTTVAIAVHELPQELSDFGVLVYGGFKRTKALLFNFMTALTAVLGALFGFFLNTFAEHTITYTLPFAAGGFIYIAASDLVPELHKEPKISKSFLSFCMFIIGIFFMWVVKFMFG